MSDSIPPRSILSSACPFVTLLFGNVADVALYFRLLTGILAAGDRAESTPTYMPKQILGNLSLEHHRLITINSQRINITSNFYLMVILNSLCCLHSYRFIKQRQDRRHVACRIGYFGLGLRK